MLKLSECENKITEISNIISDLEDSERDVIVAYVQHLCNMRKWYQIEENKARLRTDPQVSMSKRPTQGRRYIRNFMV